MKLKVSKDGTKTDLEVELNGKEDAQLLDFVGSLIHTTGIDKIAGIAALKKYGGPSTELNENE